LRISSGISFALALADGEQARTTSFGPVVVGVALRTSEVQIIDTWQSLGMRGTDSNDVAADGVFVPEARSFVVAPVPEFGFVAF
jgi:alkylation response protein AidB-like acyl-CoA dehydrogenase